MAQTLNPTRLAAVLERMASNHDGEAASAARLAADMVRKAGMTWADVIGLNVRPAGAPVYRPDSPIAFNGELLHPPHERSWVATALLLIREATRVNSRLSEADRSWLLRQAATWRTRPMKPYEAARLVALHGRLMPNSAGAS